ncbi:SDR family NAD(P)-dependent oxidoreductase [soil metagenome]
MTHFRNSTALVTGASSGLGEEFARQLAPVVGRLVLLARRTAALERLKADLESRHAQLRVQVFTVDLADEEARAEFLGELRGRDLVPDLLVNNAGLGDRGDFGSGEWSKNSAMLQVNVVALTHFAFELVPQMRERGRGIIINVSSLACLLPIPDFAVYAATKAYVSSLSEALRLEVRGSGIEVLALCPGPVRTEFGSVAARRSEDRQRAVGARAFYVSKEVVVRRALEGAAHGRARVYPGIMVCMAAGLLSALPLVIIRAIMSRRPRRMDSNV